MAEDKLTFAAIVLVAIVAIVGMIGLMGFGGFQLTGAGTTGTLNLTIQGTTSITLTDANSTLCAGYVWSNSTTASISTEGTSVNWSCTPSNDPMVVENNGSTKANVTIKAGSTAATFITGSNPLQAYRSIVNSTACTGTQQTTYTNITASETNLCGELQYDNTKRDLTVHYQLNITNDVTQGSRTNTITFTGYTA